MTDKHKLETVFTADTKDFDKSLKSVQQIVEDVEDTLQNAFGSMEDSFGDAGSEAGAFGKELADTLSESVSFIDDLKDSLKGLETIKVDTGGIDDLGNTLEDTTKGVEELDKALDDIDGVSVNGVSSELEDIGSSAKGSEGDVESLEGALDGLDSTSVGGVKSDIDDIGTSAKGSETDVESLDGAVKGVGSNSSGIDDVADGIKEIADNAKDATSMLDGMVGALGAVVGIGGLNEAFDTAMEHSEIQYSLESAVGSGRGGLRDVTEEGMKEINRTFSNLQTTLGAEGAISLITDISVRSETDNLKELNAELEQLGGASEYVAFHFDVDANEVYEESKKISKVMGISENEAIALQNTLLGIGFPPGHIDEVAEYSTTLMESGYSAQQVADLYMGIAQSDTWNVDKMADGFKEAGVTLAEYTGGIESLSDEQIALFDNAGIGSKNMVKWSKDMVKGGDKAEEAWDDLFSAITKIEDPVKKHEVMLELFKTMYEDNGNTILPLMEDMMNGTFDMNEAQKTLNDSVEDFNAQPFERIAEAMQNIKNAVGDSLTPFLEPIADILERLAENPKAIDFIVKLGVALLALTAIRGAGSFLGWLTKPLEGLSGLMDSFKKPTGSSGGSGKGSIFSPFLDTLNGFLKQAGNLVLIWGAIQLIGELADAMAEVNAKVPDDMSKMVSKLASMGLALGGMSLIIKVVGEFTKKNPKDAIAGLIGVTALTAELQYVAVAMKDLNDKVPENIKSLGKKLTNIGLAIGSMGLIVTAVGKLSNMNIQTAIVGLVGVFALTAELMFVASAMGDLNAKVPESIGSIGKKMLSISVAIGAMTAIVAVVGTLATGGALIAVVGLATVLALTLQLQHVAIAMADLNAKVPESISSIGKKMGSIAVAIGAMTAIVAVVGTLMATGVGAVVVLAGLATVVLMSEALIDVAEAIGQVNDKVPEDLGSVVGKIDNIVAVIKKMNEADLGTLMDTFENSVGALNIQAVVASIKGMVTLAKSVQELAKVEIPDNAVEQIRKIEDVMGAISRSTMSEMIGSLITAVDVLAISSVISNMVKLSENMNKLAEIEIDEDGALDNIYSVYYVLQALGNSTIGDLVNNLIESGVMATAQITIGEMVSLIEDVNKFANVEIDGDSAVDTVEQIKKVVDSLGTSRLGDIFKNLIESGTMVSAGETIKAMVELIRPSAKLGSVELDSEAIKGTIGDVKDIVGSLGTSTFGDILGNLIEKGQLLTAFDVIQEMIMVSYKLNSFASIQLNVEEIHTAIKDIEAVLLRLSESDFGSYTGALVQSSTLEIIHETINELISIRNKLNQLASVEMNMEAIFTTIKNLKIAVNEMNGFAEVTGIEGLNALVDSVISLSNKLRELTEVSSGSTETITINIQTITTQFETMVTTVGTNLDTMSEKMSTTMSSMNSTVTTGMNNIISTVRTKSSEIVSEFNGLRGKLNQAGLDAMTGLKNGINAGSGGAVAAALSVANQVSSTIQTALDIHSPSRVMMAFGRFVSEGLAKGILGGQAMVEDASNMLAGLVMPDFTGDFGNLQTSVGVDIDARPMDEIKDYRRSLKGMVNGNINTELNVRSRDDVMEGQKQPIVIQTRFGNEDYEVYVEDITRQQDKQSWIRRR